MPEEIADYNPAADDFRDVQEFVDGTLRPNWSCAVGAIAFVLMVITIAVLAILAARGWHW